MMHNIITEYGLEELWECKWQFQFSSVKVCKNLMNWRYCGEPTFKCMGWTTDYLTSWNTHRFRRKEIKEYLGVYDGY